jgi:cytochrome c-type biogenesis protein CcmH/NrfF
LDFFFGGSGALAALMAAIARLALTRDGFMMLPRVQPAAAQAWLWPYVAILLGVVTLLLCAGLQHQALAM